MRPSLPKLILAVLLTAYFLWIAYDPMQGSFLDNVDLAIHETGHLLFGPFGQFTMIAGGTILQLLFPLVFVGYFLWNEKYYSAAIVGLWFGQSLLNVYVYAADAVVGQLVLTSGITGSEGGFHDWTYMLTETGMLGSTDQIAGVIKLVGRFVIIISGILSLYLAFIPEPD